MNNKKPIRPYETHRAGEMLEWSNIIVSLVSFAQSEPGKERCQNLEFMNEPGLIRLALSETTEARGLLENGSSVNFEQLCDLTKQLTRVQARGVLDASELLRISQVLNLSRKMANLLTEEFENASNLALISDNLFSDVSLEKEISRSIDRDGTVLDNATPELKALRARYHSIHNQVHEVLDRLITSREFDEILQDGYFSLRNGRYVLPVRIEKKSQVDGIVHDISSTGQSLFIEPKQVTHLNNLLRTCELEIEREIYRFLSKLSYMVADNYEEIEQTVKWLAVLDFIFAKAKYSIRINACEPEISARGVIDLKQVRHPVLVWQGENVVANDIGLDEKRKLLIITGPNTGGKTVALKSVGICALMIQAGLHIPAASDSKMAVFKRIFALVGDEQSLEKSLSSFSAHIMGLRYIVEHLVPDSLVLIDEIGEGTDPGQGVALSKAIIEHLQTGRVRTVITTHFAELTTLAFLDGDVVNASMEFDSARFEPTYKLVPDLPGRSSAFSIAEKLGLETGIIRRARAFATGTDTRFDEVLSGMEKQREELKNLTQKTREKLELANESLEKQKSILSDLKEKKAKMIKEERSQIKEEFLAVKEKINGVFKELQNAPTFKRIEGARQKIEVVKKEVEKRFPDKSEQPPLRQQNLIPVNDWTEVKKGDRVYSRGVGAYGILDSLPDDKNMVRILVSGVKITLPETSGFFLPDQVKQSEPELSNVRYFNQHTADSASEADRTCDLRGMTAEEAVHNANEFLDQALRCRIGQVYLIHGHGTGVLKKEIRIMCKTSPYVKTWRPGKRGEGGDGATVVDIDL